MTNKKTEQPASRAREVRRIRGPGGPGGEYVKHEDSTMFWMPGEKITPHGEVKQPYAAEMAELRAQLRWRALRKLCEQSSMDPKQVVAAAIKDLPCVVAAGLAQIVAGEIERFNEQDRLVRLREDDEAMSDGARCPSETLGVPASQFLHLDEESWEECCEANELILSLRGAAFQAHRDGSVRAGHASEQAAERLRPLLERLMEDHPGMTVEEAVREMDIELFQPC
jgi:hypothetical protein